MLTTNQKSASVVTPTNLSIDTDPLHPLNSKSSAFADALQAIYKTDVDVLFKTYRASFRSICFRIRAESGDLAIISDFDYHMRYGSRCMMEDQFLSLTVERQILHLIANVEEVIADVLPKYPPAKAAIQDHASTPKNRIHDVRVRLKRYWKDSCSIRVNWLGIGNDLEYGEQFESVDSVVPEDEMYLYIRKMLEKVNKRDELRETKRKRGLRADRPLTAILQSSGKTYYDFLLATEAQRFISRPILENGDPKLIDFAGHKLIIDFCNGDIASTFDLSDNITWKRGTLKVANFDMPETLMLQCVGRRLRDVVDHPFLEGLVISNAVKSTKKRREKVIYLNTKEI